MSFFPTPKEKVIKVTAFSYKKPGISQEEFLRHFRKVHVDYFAKNPKAASKLLGYVQCPRDDEGSKEFGTWPQVDYDIAGEFYVRKLEDWNEIAAEAQHLSETVPHMDEFIDVPRMKIFVTTYEPRFWQLPSPADLK